MPPCMHLLYAVVMFLISMDVSDLGKMVFEEGLLQLLLLSNVYLPTCVPKAQDFRLVMTRISKNIPATSEDFR